MAELPTVLEYTTVHVTVEDLIENGTTATRGKVTYTPDVTTIAGIDGKITQVETVRDHLISGSSSVNLLTGITWTADFHLQGDIPAPAPITFTTDGSTINLAYEVTAAGTTPVEIRTVVLAGAATTAQVDELAAEISLALEDKADESAVVAAQAAADAANAALPAKANVADVYDKASADSRIAALAPARTAGRPGNRWVALGDSLTRGSQNDPTEGNGSTSLSYSNSWPLFAAMVSGHRLNLVKNAGINGERIDQIAARVVSDVVPYAPHLVTVGGGSNDIQQSIPRATMQANFEGLVLDLIGRFDHVAIQSITPMTAFPAEAASWFRWQQALAQRLGITFIDFYSAFVNPATGGANTAMASGDGIHPGLAGLRIEATTAIEALTPLVPPNRPALFGYADPASLLAAPLFQGTPASGFAPSWIGTSVPTGATASVITDSAIVGNVQQLVRNATTVDTSFHQSVSLSGKASSGDRVIVAMRVKFTTYGGSKSGSDVVRVKFTGAAGNRDVYASTLAEAGWMTICVEMTVPTGATDIDVSYIGTAGTGTAQFGQVTVYNATTENTVIGEAF